MLCSTLAQLFLYVNRFEVEPVSLFGMDTEGGTFRPGVPWGQALNLVLCVERLASCTEILLQNMGE